jgi:hypothetical protein
MKSPAYSSTVVLSKSIALGEILLGKGTGFAPDFNPSAGFCCRFQTKGRKALNKIKKNQ